MKSWIMVGMARAIEKDLVTLPEAPISWNSTVGASIPYASVNSAPVLGWRRLCAPRLIGLSVPGLPFADRVEVHRQFIAGGCFVERQEVTAVAQDADEGTVLERARIAAPGDELRIDRTGWVKLP